jgi:hypothetical protein
VREGAGSQGNAVHPGLPGRQPGMNQANAFDSFGRALADV